MYDVADSFKGKDGDPIRIIAQAQTLPDVVKVIRDKYKDWSHFKVKITAVKEDSSLILHIKIG